MIQKIIQLITDVIFKGKIFIPRKWIQWTAYYIVPAVLLIITFVVPQLLQEMHSSLGEAAQILLIGILFVKPFSVLFRKIGLLRTAMGLRKEFGIVAFYFAFFHFWGYTIELPFSAWEYFVRTIQHTGSGVWYGAVALLIFFVLYLTSNKLSTKYLKKWWKRLHRIVYISLPFVLIHAALMEGEGYVQAIALTAFFIALKVAEWIYTSNKKKKRKEKIVIS